MITCVCDNFFVSLLSIKNIDKVMDLKGLKFAWLSPTGRIITNDEECYDYNHNELAACILRDLWKLPSKQIAWEKVHVDMINVYCFEVLENKGWIRLHGWSKPKFIIPYNKTITKKQEETIIEWCIENNILFDDAISL